MDDIRKIAHAIVAREGGFVDDPDDPGGATNYGVTIGTLRALGRDKDGDGRVTVRDLRRLTREDAVEIFLDHYYVGPGVNALPQVVQASVFDMVVNAGAHGVRVLQSLLTDMGLACDVDGVVGPETIAQAARAAEIAPDHLRDAYGIARRNYYYALADRRATSRKYARRRDGGKGGWITRAEAFMAPRYHLSRAEHDRRVAAWA